MYLFPGINYTIMMDGAPGPVEDPLKIGVVPNPVFTTINPDDQKQISGSVKSIAIIVCDTSNGHNCTLMKSLKLSCSGNKCLECTPQ